MADLTKEQKEIIRMIEKEAKAAGVDPDFAVALASLESGFKHVPADDKKSTAFGPFQVNKATAEANGVDYEKMKHNPELAVRTGIMNIVRHANNPDLRTENPNTGEKEVDPMRIAAAHRLGEHSDYAKTGDMSKMTPELRSYLASAMEHFPEESFPERVYSKPSENVEAKEGPANDMGSVPLGTYDQAADQQGERYLGAAEGAGAGAFLGAFKAPIVTGIAGAKDLYKRWKEGKITAQDFNDMAEAAMKVNAQGVETPEVTTSVPDEELTAGEKWAKKTGYGEGKGTVKNVVDRRNLATPKGKLAKRVYEQRKAAESLAAARTAEELMAEKAAQEAQAAQTLQEHQNWANEWNTAEKQGSNAKMFYPRGEPQNFSQRLNAEAQNLWNRGSNAVSSLGGLARNVVQSSPVKWGLGGMGAVYNLENADQQFKQNTALGNAAGVTSLGGALASGLSAVPKYAAKANPAAIALTSGAQVLGDIGRGDYDSAKASGYLGGLGLASLPVAIGALVPSSLNRGEMEELERRRKMQPTITRP
jgi:hypothetical protein